MEIAKAGELGAIEGEPGVVLVKKSQLSLTIDDASSNDENFNDDFSLSVHHNRLPPWHNSGVSGWTTDFKNHSLPLARIKKIMKANNDVHTITTEALVV
ncbi:hypothetical protein GUJ93_ZPchr0012g19295 [Zizania palustris]|uniref:Transcription factor CBF/NF-Y/archaeal histone domain-containing protein n=1 Tax=Zizania palustris TaxID=103762 RepID=A0A8J5WUX2_ZIZPA|nr:hypothetical protein GUJ93_ZPchr0012g19295 [Zizania palustris]